MFKLLIRKQLPPVASLAPSPHSDHPAPLNERTRFSLGRQQASRWRAHSRAVLLVLLRFRLPQRSSDRRNVRPCSLHSPQSKLTSPSTHSGAGSGIGRAVAMHLAARGARLALTDINGPEGRSTCEEIKGLGYDVDMVFATLDCTGSSPLFFVSPCEPRLMWGWKTDEAAVGKLVRTFKKSYNRLDGLVNCAGTSSSVISSFLLSDPPPFNLQQASASPLRQYTRSHSTCGTRRWTSTSRGRLRSVSTLRCMR